MEVDEPVGKERIVHLDLKGAPPKISYFSHLFPLLAQWGATGVLVEYEDMFPYHGELQVLAAPVAYTAEEIDQFLKVAETNNLKVIPLVQTFGHFEFVLKHNKFHRLREIAEYPMALCPLHQDSIEVVKAMLDQVIQLHPNIHAFHIGADEVFHLGFCEVCQKHLEAMSCAKEELFFFFIRKVLHHLRDKYPHIRRIMWDDMFRSSSLQLLKDSKLGTLVEPMVWYYHSVFTLTIDKPDLFDRYAAVFPSIWAATAFKGATGPSQVAVDIRFHIDNHKGWITAMEKYASKFHCFHGYALTGWQRYDHYSMLCELLPVGLPCLALCLLTLQNGAFTMEIHKQASNDLNFKELIPLTPFSSIGHIPHCGFPGCGVYISVNILLYLTHQFKMLKKNDRYRCWMTDYHIRHKFANPAHIQNFLPQVVELEIQFEQLRRDLDLVMNDIFLPETVDEWQSTHIHPKMAKIKEIHKQAKYLLDIGAQPKESPTMLNDT